jgi:hypothetical protein
MQIQRPIQVIDDIYKKQVLISRERLFKVSFTAAEIVNLEKRIIDQTKGFIDDIKNNYFDEYDRYVNLKKEFKELDVKTRIKKREYNRLCDLLTLEYPEVQKSNYLIETFKECEDYKGHDLIVTLRKKSKKNTVEKPYAKKSKRVKVFLQLNCSTKITSPVLPLAKKTIPVISFEKMKERKPYKKNRLHVKTIVEKKFTKEDAEKIKKSIHLYETKVKNITLHLLHKDYLPRFISQFKFDLDIERKKDPRLQEDYLKLQSYKSRLPMGDNAKDLFLKCYQCRELSKGKPIPRDDTVFLSMIEWINSVMPKPEYRLTSEMIKKL